MEMAAEQSRYLKNKWFIPTLLWLGCVAALTAIFYSTAEGLVLKWSNSTSYNHCFMIIPISLYLIWDQKNKYLQFVPQKNYWSLLYMLVAGLIWLLGEIAGIVSAQQFAFVMALQASILAVFGWPFFKAALFPIMYLFFMVPFGDFLIPYLQDWTAWFLVKCLILLNIPVYWDGVFISIPTGDFHVAEACSGLRFLTATIAVGFLMAYMGFQKTWKRAIVVSLSLIIPIIANGFRATGIVLIAYYTNHEYAVGVDHLIYGWIFFAFILLVFIGIVMWFADPMEVTAASLPIDSVGKGQNPWAFLQVILPLVILASAPPLYAGHIAAQQTSVAQYTYKVTPPSGWGAAPLISQKVVWTPQYAGAHITQQTQFMNGQGQAVDFYAAYYAYQSKERELVRFGNSVIQPAKFWDYSSSKVISLSHENVEIPTRQYILKSLTGQRLVWMWYVVDGEIVTSDLYIKVLTAKNKLFAGTGEAGVLAISVPYRELELDDAVTTLSSFFQQMGPIEKMYRPEIKLSVE